MNTREKFESKNPLWVEFHILFDNVINKNISLEKSMNNLFLLSFKMLKETTVKSELKEIIIAFENLKDNILAIYGVEAVNYFERDIVKEIMSSFNSLIFEYDYMKEILQLINNLSTYLVNK